MRFKVGDVCEIVMTDERYKILRGLECTIVGIRNDWFTDSYDISCPDGLVHWITVNGLRLKRPPSWDSWLYDTSPVQNESTAGETA